MGRCGMKVNHLRHSFFKAVRDDKLARDVVKENAKGDSACDGSEA
jgi:hypothetical protein